MKVYHLEIHIHDAPEELRKVEFFYATPPSTEDARRSLDEAEEEYRDYPSMPDIDFPTVRKILEAKGVPPLHGMIMNTYQFQDPTGYISCTELTVEDNS